LKEEPTGSLFNQLQFDQHSITVLAADSVNWWAG
jgi:hypothetical protein